MKHLISTFPNLIAGAEKWTNDKASLVWAVVDGRPARYRTIPDTASRSRTNLCFRVVDAAGAPDEDATKAFVAEADSRGLTGLKGHRAMGGLRVGNFSSVSEQGVRRLVSFMEEFAERK